MSDEKRKITFSPPTIGPREYLVRGSSGWPDIFEKKAADEELEKFITKNGLSLELVISSFMNASAEQEVSMQDRIQGHLSRIGKLEKAEDVPIPVTIAFWAKLLTTKREKDKAAENSRFG